MCMRVCYHSINVEVKGLETALLPTEDDPILPEIPRCDDNPLETTVVIPTTWLSNTFREILTRRPFVSEFHNFLYGMQLHTDYLQNRQFSMWKGTPTWAGEVGRKEKQAWMWP